MILDRQMLLAVGIQQSRSDPLKINGSLLNTFCFKVILNSTHLPLQLPHNHTAMVTLETHYGTHYPNLTHLGPNLTHLRPNAPETQHT